MRHYLLFALFTLGFIGSIIERIQFERKKKHEKDAEYRSLFRRHSTLLIIFFACLRSTLWRISRPTRGNAHFSAQCVGLFSFTCVQYEEKSHTPQPCASIIPINSPFSSS